MRTIHLLIFDDFIVGTAQVFTDPKWNWTLAQADRLRLYGVVDQVTGSSVTLSAQIQESPDNRNFQAKNTNPEILNAAIGTTATVQVSGYDGSPYNPPLSGYVRVAMQIGNGTTGIGAHVKLYVTGRGEVVGSSSGG